MNKIYDTVTKLHFKRKRFNAYSDYIWIYSQTQHVETNYKHHEYYPIKTFFTYLLDNETFKKLSVLISLSSTHETSSFSGIPPN